MDIDVAIDKLGAFGSADEVARFLADQGVKGHRGGAVSCPIARWLERETGLHVAVFECHVKARDPFVDGWDEDWDSEWEIATGAAVRAFVGMFDEGEAYGWLVDETGTGQHACPHGVGW